MRFNADDFPPKNGKAACVEVSKDANPNSSRVGTVKDAVNKDFLSKIPGSGMQDLIVLYFSHFFLKTVNTWGVESMSMGISSG